MMAKKVNPVCTPQQQDIVRRILQNRESLFISGEAGTGKSFLVHHLVELWKIQNTKYHITATTGISAFHLRGTTIHSCLGVGTIMTTYPMDRILRKVRRNRAALDRIRSMDVLLIDEISMMSAVMWERMNLLFQTLRRCFDRPFGGCQLVVLGDFFQLLPVFDNEKEEDQRLVFQSAIWTDMFRPGHNIIILTTNFRQHRDPEFATLLRAVRQGQRHHHESLMNMVKDAAASSRHVQSMYLVPTRKRAHELNVYHRHQLSSAEHHYEAVFSGSDDERIEEMKRQFDMMHLLIVTLKEGCRVMLICNLDISRGLINGSMGTVVELQTDVVMVRFDHLSEEVVPVTVFAWKADEDETKAMGQQIPLIIAYALTIHKSQSLTLETATLELGQCFAPHQAYVALSRLQSRKGMHLHSYRPQSVFCDDRVVEYMKELCDAKIVEKI